MNSIARVFVAGLLAVLLHASGMSNTSRSWPLDGTEIACPSADFTLFHVDGATTGPPGAAATTVGEAQRLALAALKEQLIEEFEVTCGPCSTSENPDAECELKLDIPSSALTYPPITGSGMHQFQARVADGTRLEFWCNETENCPPLP